MAEENDTLKLTSVNYTSDNYLAAKKNEDGSYNVADKVVFNEDITTPGGEVATKADLDGKQDKLTAGENITITEDNVISAASDDIGGIVYYGYTNASLTESHLKEFLEMVVAPSVNTEYGDFNIYLLIDGYGSNLIHYTNGAYDYSTFPGFPDIQASAKIILDNEYTMSKTKVLEKFNAFNFMAETIELIPAANVFYNRY